MVLDEDLCSYEQSLIYNPYGVSCHCYEIHTESKKYFFAFEATLLLIYWHWSFFFMCIIQPSLLYIFLYFITKNSTILLLDKHFSLILVHLKLICIVYDVDCPLIWHIDRFRKPVINWRLIHS